MVTTKINKEHVKREAEKLLQKLTLQLMNPGLTQPGTLFKAQRNSSLFSYTAALQREAER